MKRFALCLAALLTSVSAFALDHSHKAWDELLKKRVRYVENGNASRVNYAGFAKDRSQLKADVAFLEYDWGLNDARQ